MNPSNTMTEVLGAGKGSAGLSLRAEAFRAAICEVTCNVSAEHFGRELRAIVLTGSLARDEATFVKEGERWKALGDADFFLIFRSRSPLPPASATESLQQKIGEFLLQRGLLCNVGLSPVHPHYLRVLPPHISPYELRACGRVVWGDLKILSLIPRFTAAQISLEDAWRLLANRIIEQLEGMIFLPERHENVSQDLRYRTLKLYLDMATSFLVFMGKYEPTYRKREQALKHLADVSCSSPEQVLPFSLPAFAERVSVCTKLKLEGCAEPASYEGLRSDSWEALWKDSFEFAHQLWRWELSRLTGARGDPSDRELLFQCMELQPAAARVRGWASVLRRAGWVQSWREWPRWAPFAWRASPRYWVYEVAIELFFRIPRILYSSAGQGELDSDWTKLADYLPFREKLAPQSGRPSWRWLAAQVARNYRGFLETTRA